MNKAESYLLGATKRIAKKAGDTKKRAEQKLQNTGATIRKNATAFVADVKKSGFHPMDDKGIIGNAPQRVRLMKKVKKQ